MRPKTAVCQRKPRGPLTLQRQLETQPQLLPGPGIRILPAGLEIQTGTAAPVQAHADIGAEALMTDVHSGNHGGCTRRCLYQTSRGPVFVATCVIAPIQAGSKTHGRILPQRALKARLNARPQPPVTLPAGRQSQPQRTVAKLVGAVYIDTVKAQIQ